MNGVVASGKAGNKALRTSSAVSCRWLLLPILLLLLSAYLQTAIVQDAGPQPVARITKLVFRTLAGRSNHDAQPGPAEGVFPQGCKWRSVRWANVNLTFWGIREYEYWDQNRQAWRPEKPAGCLLETQNKPQEWPWRDGSPRTQVECDDSHCLYQNLWYNDGRWYLLIGDDRPSVGWWQLTQNQQLHVLHVKNSAEFIQLVDHRVVKGDSLVFDFVFFLHPTAIGHWGEMMFPLYSILRHEEDFKVPPDRFLMLHLKREHLVEWPRAVMAATLGLSPGELLPPIIMQEEHHDARKQVAQPLEGVKANEWLCFERALVVRDIFNGGVRSFLRQDDAQAFRAAIYRNHGLPPPAYRIPPRVITFQRKRANRRVVNEKQLLRLLHRYGEVRVVEFNSSTPFKQQLQVIASTGVFVSVHTSNLANAPFLQPGSAVFEIIQRNWAWAGIDRSFKVQTEVMGDIHHFAWRAQLRNQTLYLNQRDGEKFGSWPPHLCTTEECVEAHTNVDVVVDLRQFKKLLDSRLPLVFNGTSVADAALPWPPAGVPEEVAESESASPHH